MSKSFSESVSELGNTVSDAAKKVGNTIAQGTEEAVDFVKEKTGIGTVEGKDVGLKGIKDHMSVIASCGKTMGSVDRVEGNAIKLTRKDSPDGQHHYIPLNWVAVVDNHVHLNRNSKEVEGGWKSSASSCDCH